MFDTPLRRLAIATIAVGAVASMLVAADRFRFEHDNRAVEVTMDQQDLADFARAFGYDYDELLRSMHANGLTSVAVYEELGIRVNASDHAQVLSGQQLADAARLTPLADPLLSTMTRERRVDPNSVYLIAYDRPTFERYLNVLRTQLEPRNVRVLRTALPGLIAVRTQLDFFNSMGLGIPEDVARRVRAHGLFVDPRVQNNERLTPERISAVFDRMLAGGETGAVIFFGQRNEVLGFPYQLEATAEQFRARHVTFGDVEAYDPNQIQKGSETLARKVVGQTVRVQAISKVELDKLRLDTVVARYVLGVRERNIRVIYLRPFPHLEQVKRPDGSLQTLTAEQTNLLMLSELRDTLNANGFTLGRADGFKLVPTRRFEILFFLAALGVAAAFVLLLDVLSVARPWMFWAALAITTAAFWAAALLGHDDLMRRFWALGGALTFAVLAGCSLAPYLRGETPVGALAQARAGIVALARSIGVALLGGLFVIGLLSQATFMIEVDQSLGTKLVLVGPALILILIYAFSDVFGARVGVGEALGAPVRAWHVAALIVLAAGAALLVVRSGNQPDIGVSDFEAHLRGSLSAFFGARPRFKDFLIGFPAIVLLPALLPAHRRFVGWLFVLAAGVGLADVLDTFTHIHTALIVSALRMFNAALIGALIGLIAQALYRAALTRVSRT